MDIDFKNKSVFLNVQSFHPGFTKLILISANFYYRISNRRLILKKEKLTSNKFTFIIEISLLLMSKSKNQPNTFQMFL